jgi:hypothetical protein
VSAPRTAGGGGVQPWLLGGFIGLVVLLGVLAVGAGSSGRPLSPSSDEELGTSALVALAGDLGAEVDVADRLPDLDGPEPPDVVLLFQDLLDEAQTAEVEDWVGRGGVLVVTDSLSSFAPAESGFFDEVSELGTPARLTAACEIDALDGIDAGGIEPHNGGLLYAPPLGSASCVGYAGGAYIVASGDGDGTVVAMGGAGLLVNAALDEGENAPVAAAFLAPREGTRLTVLEPGFLGSSGGDGDSLVDLISPGVKRGLLQAALAFAVYALWRARRLGRPVPERQPVAVAGSELVAAVGNLLDRSRSPQHAAALLQADLRRFLADRLGVPAGAGVDVLVAVAAGRTSLDEAELRKALAPGPVASDAALADLARTIDRIREEVLAHV